MGSSQSSGITVNNYFKFGPETNPWIIMCCTGINDENYINCSKYHLHWYCESCLKKDYSYTDAQLDRIKVPHVKWIFPYCVEKN